jgi:hypothetical protein
MTDDEENRFVVSSRYEPATSRRPAKRFGATVTPFT